MLLTPYKGHCYSPGVIALLSSMLIVDPDARATANAILERTKKMLLNAGNGGGSESGMVAMVADGGLGTTTQPLSSSHSYNTFGEVPAAAGAAANPVGSDANSWASFK